MKKIILILSVIFCCSTALAQQKEKNKQIRYREDESILFPALEFRFQYYSQDLLDSNFTSAILLGSYNNIESDYSLSAECTYRLFRYLEVGGQIGYSRISFYDNYSVCDRKNKSSFYFMPKVRCTWYEYSIVRLYSSFSMGLLYMNSSKNYMNNNMYGAFITTLDLVPLGIAVGGENWFGFCEFLNYGDLGHSSFGVGYRFPVK